MKGLQRELEEEAGLAAFRVASDLAAFGATRDEVNDALARVLPVLEAIRARREGHYRREADEPLALSHELQ